LGQRIEVGESGEKMIQTSLDGVFLIEESETGVEPIRIGDSVEKIANSADLVQLTKIHDAVSVAAERMNEDQKKEILDKIKSEDVREQRKHGAASVAYKNWCRTKNELYRLAK
jgi:hypothetical protein